MAAPEPPIRLPWSLGEFLSGARSAIGIIVVLVGLVAWSVRQESRISQLEATNHAQDRRLDDFDVHGTRAVIVLTEHLTALAKSEAEANTVINGRIQVINDKINAVDNLLRRLDVIITRQDEGQRRLEALDRRLEALERALNLLQHNHNLRYHLLPRGPDGSEPR